MYRRSATRASPCRVHSPRTSSARPPTPPRDAANLADPPEEKIRGPKGEKERTKMCPQSVPPGTLPCLRGLRSSRLWWAEPAKSRQQDCSFGGHHADNRPACLYRRVWHPC